VAEKAELRKESIARRAALADREVRAGRIATRVAELPEFRQAKLLAS
jgi:5-formyltetrahydrofolate cyclo-ligase